jgi:hypothetical protein
MSFKDLPTWHLLEIKKNIPNDKGVQKKIDKILAERRRHENASD